MKQIPFVDQLEDIILWSMDVQKDVADGIATHVTELTDQHYVSLFLQNPDAVFRIDYEGRFTEVNPAATKLTGYAKEELLNRRYDFLLFPEELGRAREILERLNKGETFTNIEFLCKTKSACPRNIELTIAPLLVNNEPMGFQGVVKDITERKYLMQISEHHRLISEIIAKGEPLTSILESLIFMAESYFREQFCCIHLMDNSGTYIETSIAPNMPYEYIQGLNKIKVGPKSGSGGAALYHGEPVISADIEQDPSWETWRDHALQYHFRACWSQIIKSSDGRALGAMSVYSFQPHTPTEHELQLMGIIVRLAGMAIDKKQNDENIHRLTFHDILTGLLNRQGFHVQLKNSLQDKRKGKFGILFIDIDRFKPINNTFGHTVGDLFLQKVARTLQDCLENSGTLARIGGDEFTVLIPVLKDNNELLVIVNRLIQALKKPIIINGFEIIVTISVGATVFPSGGDDEITLMKNAEIALYKAKEDRNNQVQIYESWMDKGSYDRFVLTSEFNKGLLKNEFTLHYQPRLNVVTNTVECFEALVRWNHPKKGCIPPNDFIPLAEETGFILKLGQWVLDEACRQAAAWRDMGVAPVRIAVNVSVHQFMRTDFFQLVKSALFSHKLDAKWLEIEITETTLMQSEETNIQIINQLRDYGVKVSIDDFGTGYSSLHYLKKFKVNTLKIDKSFVSDLPNDTITKTIIQLAHSLGLEVVAEGVDLQEQIDYLVENGCEQVQGYLIGKPVPPEQCIPFLLHQ